jgi:sugar/nucleoside kinase (ribokinase family)
MRARMIEHVTFGIIIDDLIFPDGSTQMGVLGGGGPQTAWGMAAALGSGQTVGLVAGVGNDLDEKTLAPLRNAGINLDGLRQTNNPTPRAWQIYEHDGRRTQVWRTSPRDLGEQLAKNFDVLPEDYYHTANLHWGVHPGDAGLSFARELRTQDRCVSLEAFKEAAQPLSDRARANLFSSCDVFSASQSEFGSLFTHNNYDEAIAEAGESGLSVLVIRKGAQGVSVYDYPNQRAYHAPALPAEVVDVTGAGNAFSGAFIARLADGVAKATCHGLVTAAYMIEYMGVPPTLPDPNDYQQRMDDARRSLNETSL